MQFVRFHKMAERLSVKDFAQWMHGQVHTTKETLIARNYTDEIARYGQSMDIARAALEEAVRADAEAETKRALGKASVVSYVATEGVGDREEKYAVVKICRGMPLHRIRVPLPPPVARRIPLMREKVSLLPNSVYIAGWTASGREGSLTDVYREALRKVGEDELPWTIEPVDSLEQTHARIRNAGFNAHGEQAEYYDLGLDVSGWSSLPASYLYTVQPVIRPEIAEPPIGQY